MATHENYIQHLHAFRGFAIINIVGAHAWSFPIFWTGQLDPGGISWLFYLTETLFHGSTLYFAIISGLLFSKVLSSKSWSSFYKSKLFNVVMPFAFMSILMTSQWWEFYQQQNLHSEPWLNYILVNLMHIFDGGAALHFWYIPVLLFLFAMTPVLVKLQNKAPWTLFILALLPLLISRSPFPEFLKPQSFVYFLGAYALGMVIGSYYQQIMGLVNKHFAAVALLAIGSTVLVLLHYVWEFQHHGMFSSLQTIIYVQKVTLCLLVLRLFQHNEATLPGWLKTLGSYAFAIYFLHFMAIVMLIQLSREFLSAHRDIIYFAPLGLVNLVAAIGISILISKLLQLILKRHSRKLIGA